MGTVAVTVVVGVLAMPVKVQPLKVPTLPAAVYVTVVSPGFEVTVSTAPSKLPQPLEAKVIDPPLGMYSGDGAPVRDLQAPEDN